MKKIYLLACLVLFSLAGFSQSFTGPTSANSGSTITLTVLGESSPNPLSPNAYAISAVTQISSNLTHTSSPGTPGTTLSNFNAYFSATIDQVINTYIPSHMGTTITVKLKNTCPWPITALIYITSTVNTTSGATNMNIPYTIVVNPDPATSALAFINNGDFVMNDNTQQIFFEFEHQLRYIPTPATLYGLWTMNLSMLKHFTTNNLVGVPVGASFTADNGFILDKNNANRVYLREGNYIRWIPTSQIFNAYHFNWNTITNVYGISGYTVGPDIGF